MKKPQRILIVDDEADTREVIAEMLMLAGFQVDTAEDGVQGWNTLMFAAGSNREDYDLLITDNNMPKLSGIELIKKMRSAGISMPVILASGTAPANVESLELAAVMTKPFMPVNLVEVVKRVISSGDSGGLIR